jgi:geranylgeranyl diphosphate synthase type I
LNQTSTLTALTGRSRPLLRGLWSAEGLDDVEIAMRRLVAGGRVDRLGIVLRELLESGGKRLRARLALATLEALGEDRQKGVAWAAACELLHTATLLHDDVQDGDTVRRDRPTAWRSHGVAQAINAGDLALMLPYSAIDHIPVEPAVKWQLTRLLARYAEAVARGQADEMELMPHRHLAWDDYAAAACGKTAALFALPVAGAALIAGRTPEEAEDLGDAMLQLGLLFQIQDDVLDLFGDKRRGEPGSDVVAGKATALVVEHLRRVPHDREWLVELLEAPRETKTPEVVAEVKRAFRERGTLDAVWDRLNACETHIAESLALSRWPRLHAVAVELAAQALAPIAHTAPIRVLGGVV